MTLYNKALIDEEENVLQEVLKTAAKEKLTNEVNRRREEEEWRHCFRVEEIQVKTKKEEKNQHLLAHVDLRVSLLLTSGYLSSLLFHFSPFFFCHGVIQSMLQTRTRVNL